MIGRALGPYRIEAELGSGGMGTVYRAALLEPLHGLAAGDPVALKVVHPHLLARQGFFHRFLREAEVGARLTHPNVVRTLDADTIDLPEGTSHFLVMEFVEGRTLRSLLRELRTIPEALLREIGRQVAAGLCAIHEAGAVHRDLKPENVLITGDHQVRIMDLGVARLVEESATLTTDGQFAGSLFYAAPEQFRGGKPGPASDLYATGVLLLELATGSNPFRSDQAASIIQAHLETVPAPASRANPEISAFLSELISTLLEKDPARRIPSARSLGRILTEGEWSAWWREREGAVLRRRGRLPDVPVPRMTRVFGRERELAELGAAWLAACAGGGGTVFLEGEAGIGKTRLVDAFLEERAGEDAHVLYGSYPPSGGRGALSEALVQRFGEAGLEDALRPYLGATPALVPAFASMVRHEAVPEGAERIQGDALHALFVSLFRALSREKPLLFVLDDLQFAQEDSRGIILALARAAVRERALLLLTARPGLPEEEMAHFHRLDGFRKVALARLGARDVIEVLRDAFRSEALAEKLGGKIAWKSDGVPYFVLEIVRGLKEGRLIGETPDGSYVETEVIGDIDVPSAVRDLILGRLAAISDQDRDLLDVAATQGYDFEPDLVARVCGMNRVRALQRLAAVERRTGVVRSKPGAYRFDHHQVQEVLYRDLPPDLRAEYHALLAEAAEGLLEGRDPSGEVAWFLVSHHVRGSRPRAALAHLERALEHLERGYRNEAVVDLARRALGIEGLLEGESRLSVLHRAAQCCGHQGRRDEERSLLDEMVSAAEAGGRDEWLAKALLALGHHFVFTHHPAEAEPRLRRARELARSAGDRELEASIAGQQGNVLYTQSRFEEARAVYEEHLRMAREGGSRRGIAAATGSLGNVASILGRYDEARDYFERAREAMRERGDRRGEATSLLNLGTMYLRMDRLEEARPCYEEALGISREIGYRRGVSIATGNLGILEQHRGREAEALRCHRECLEIARETGDLEGECSVLVNLSSLLSTLGEPEEAEERIREALAASGKASSSRMRAYALHQQGTLAAERGDPEASREHYAEARRLFEEIRYPRGVESVRGALGLMLLDVGDGEEGRRILEDLLGGPADPSAEVGRLVIRAALASRGHGDPGPVEADLARLADRLDLREHVRVRMSLYRATGERTHLEAAWERLGRLRDQAPEEYRESIMERVSLHREVAEAWRDRPS